VQVDEGKIKVAQTYIGCEMAERHWKNWRNNFEGSRDEVSFVLFDHFTLQKKG
jgi:hypothetical protein